MARHGPPGVDAAARPGHGERTEGAAPGGGLLPACCRRVTDSTADPAALNAVAATESFADGLVTSEQLDTAYRAASRLVDELEQVEEKEPQSPGWWADVARFW